MTIAFFIFIQILSYVSSLELEDPHQNGVTISVNENSRVRVTVDENNDGGRIKILLITDADEPQISSWYFLEYDSTLGPKIEKEDPNYVLTVNLLDYDALVASGKLISYSLEIEDGETSKDVVVRINNLDDESPKLEEHSCSIEEETAIDVNNSDCYLTINDPDGWLGTMNFTIVESGVDIFELKFKETPNDNIPWGYIYLVLKEDQKLDFETKDSYEIQVKVTDGAGHPGVPESVTISITVTDKRPVWTSLPFIKHIVEESETSFIISAIDDDTNSNHEVKYSLNDRSGYFTINSATGNISVASIDREKIYNNITLSVKAYYSDTESIFTVEQIFVTIDDIDDNAAIIDQTTSAKISVYEDTETFSSYAYINDLDSGENSIYSIDLKVPDELSSAFNFPKRGSGYNIFQISGNATQVLAYLHSLKQDTFQIELKTTGIKTPENTDTAVITVSNESKIRPNSSSGLRTTWIILLLISSVRKILV